MLCLNNLEIREKLHLAVAETRVVDERRVIISFIRVRHMRDIECEYECNDRGDNTKHVHHRINSGMLYVEI